VRRLRLVVLGIMGRLPFGGQTWLYLNWLRGLGGLGHDVWYVEDDTAWPYDPQQNAVTDRPDYAIRHVAASCARVGLADRWAYRLVADRPVTAGLAPAALDALYRECDALLNIGGAVELREEHLAAPLRVYVQTDPVTSELQLAAGDAYTRQEFAKHHVLATYGENYGAPDCGVPLAGARYVTTRQPIDLALWPAAPDPDARHFTTIGNYRQHGKDVVLGGETYRWSKHGEWEKFLDLPRRTRQSFEVALKTDEVDRARLQAHGWRVVSPLPFSLDVFGAYPGWIRRSRGEFTVAKDQNVRLRSGWFSERDACYVASGKPVVAQDTGFGAALPLGKGLFAVSTVEEAAAAVEAINADYPAHAAAARALAEEHFEATAVAGRLLRAVGLASP
jgi:hypothetical protein